MLHAYVIAPDWNALGSNPIEKLMGLRPFVSLVCLGLLFGLSVEVAKFVGAVFRSEAAVLFFPIAAGAMIGGAQGAAIPTELWGFPDAIVFRSETLLVVTGAVSGLLLAAPTIILSMRIRNRGRPW